MLYFYCSESAGRGWRLLIIITAYIKCTECLEPYLIKFLQDTASDPKREFHGMCIGIDKGFLYITSGV